MRPEYLPPYTLMTTQFLSELRLYVAKESHVDDVFDIVALESADDAASVSINDQPVGIVDLPVSEVRVHVHASEGSYTIIDNEHQLKQAVQTIVEAIRSNPGQKLNITIQENQMVVDYDSATAKVNLHTERVHEEGQELMAEADASIDNYLRRVYGVEVKVAQEKAEDVIVGAFGHAKAIVMFFYRLAGKLARGLVNQFPRTKQAISGAASKVSQAASKAWSKISNATSTALDKAEKGLDKLFNFIKSKANLKLLLIAAVTFAVVGLLYVLFKKRVIHRVINKIKSVVKLGKESIAEDIAMALLLKNPDADVKQTAIKAAKIALKVQPRVVKESAGDAVDIVLTGLLGLVSIGMYFLSVLLFSAIIGFVLGMMLVVRAQTKPSPHSDYLAKFGTEWSETAAVMTEKVLKVMIAVSAVRAVLWLGRAALRLIRRKPILDSDLSESKLVAVNSSLNTKIVDKMYRLA